jgi:deoxyhypusine synthase
MPQSKSSAPATGAPGSAKTWTKEELLSKPIQHVDVKTFDARPVIDSYRQMAYSSRNLATAADIFSRMLADTECAVILTLAGSLVSAGLKRVFIDLLETNMVDAIVSSGANIVDQDFFEGLGFKHWIAPGSPEAPPVDDLTLRNLMIDRIYDTYIDEDDLRACDETTKKIFDGFEPGAYSSREFIDAMGKYLVEHHPQNDSLVRTAHLKRVPIFCPAFSDCSAGFGLVLHQVERREAGQPHVAVDSAADFRELTDLKLASKDTGLLMLGGGVPKNFTSRRTSWWPRSCWMSTGSKVGQARPAAAWRCTSTRCSSRWPMRGMGPSAAARCARRAAGGRWMWCTSRWSTAS